MESFLKNIGVGIRPINDPFFEDSYKTCKVFVRSGVVVQDEEELCHQDMKEFLCNAAGCKARFKNLLDYEIHYNGSHRYVCGECKKIKPNSRLLEIHIQETHDSFFQVLAEKQPMYQCYVPECDLKFNNSMEREEHCLIVHKFPKHFRFSEKVVNKNQKKDRKDEMEVDGNTIPMEKPTESNKSMKKYLNKNQKCKTFNPNVRNNVSKEIPTERTDNSSNSRKDVSSSSLFFVPRQVQMSYSKVLTKGQTSECNVLESDCMMDIAKSLPK